MANRQEYSFTQFPSIQMVRSFLQYVSMLNSLFVFLVYMYRIFKTVGVAQAARGSIKSWAPDKTWLAVGNICRSQFDWN